MLPRAAGIQAIATDLQPANVEGSRTEKRRAPWKSFDERERVDTGENETVGTRDALCARCRVDDDIVCPSNSTGNGSRGIPFQELRRLPRERLGRRVGDPTRSRKRPKEHLVRGSKGGRSVENDEQWHDV